MSLRTFKVKRKEPVLMIESAEEFGHGSALKQHVEQKEQAVV